MATATATVTVTGTAPTCTKSLSESQAMTSIPSNYVYSTNVNETKAADLKEEEDSIPIVDFSSLTSSDPDQRSKAIQHFGKICQDWGFFVLVNHGVPESLTKGLIEGYNEFFQLPEEQKKAFGSSKDVMDPMRYGTSLNFAVEKILLWRDFLRCFVHPHFHFPNQPNGFREVASECAKQVRAVAGELLKAVSVDLGLEEKYMENAMDLESGCQILAGNFYPPCPQPEYAIGLPPHTDYGLLTLLLLNGVGGLQLQTNGQWFNSPSIPNSFIVHVADQLEILSNGKYKSVVHRAVVNNKTTRISLAMSLGPSTETVVGPVPPLLADGTRPQFSPMKYFDYMQLKQSPQLSGQSALDYVRIRTE